jgi:hypothetical protein
MTHDASAAMRMLSGINPEHLGRILWHARKFTNAALSSRDASGRFRLDDLQPIANLLGYLGELVMWSELRDERPEQWAELQRGAQ